MAKYVKLGRKAECFYDPYTNLKVVKGQVLEMTKKQQVSPKTKRALQTGHLENATVEDYNKFNDIIENPPEKTDFDEMTKAELVQYLDDNYEVDEDELKAFKKKNKELMIEELEDLAKE